MIYPMERARAGGPAPERVERRAGAPERRRRLAFGLLYGGLNPRRRGGRRADDQHRPVVDWHGPGLFASCVIVLFLCVADAFLTLGLISGGAFEANPVMALVVYGSARVFALTKVGLTGAGMLIMVAVARFRVFGEVRAAMLVHVALAIYVLLVGYELHLALATT